MWKKTFKNIHQLSCFVGHPVLEHLNILDLYRDFEIKKNKNNSIIFRDLNGTFVNHACNTLDEARKARKVNCSSVYILKPVLSLGGICKQE